MGSRECIDIFQKSPFNRQLFLSVLIKNFSYLEILIVLVIILRFFWKLEIVEEFKLPASRPIMRKQHDQISRCFLVVPKNLKQEASLKKGNSEV